jgi:serine/threonine-protein kinase
MTTQFTPGATVDNKYLVERPLGEGGMGVVWLARDVHTDMLVVLKAIRDEYAHRKDFRDRILAEGRALARIDHPNVVRLNAVVADADTLCLVMQYVEGDPLDKRIERHLQEGVPMPVNEALRIFRQIVQGVAAAHHEGIIHRDLKPANVLVRAKDGMVKVTDFGIAKAEQEAREGKGQTQGTIGSAHYMAPEQCTGRRDLDKRVDIYALGIVLFELVTGRLPYDGDSQYEVMKQHVESPVPSLAGVRPDAPAWLDAVLQRCCAKNRDDRYASCEDLLKALDRGSASTRHDTAAMPAAPSGSTAPAAPLPEALGVKAPTAAGAAVTASSKDTAGGGAPMGAILGGTIVVAALAGVGIAWGLGWIGPPRGKEKPTREAHEAHETHDTHGSSTPAGTGRSEQPGARAAKKPLQALAGAWRSEKGSQFVAVVVGEVLEMRIRDAEPFKAQGYEQDEVRFLLREKPGQPDVYLVEDRLRPTPPPDLKYDPERARATCLVPFSSAGDSPLEARLAEGKLRVQLVKIAPARDMFNIQGKRVVGCKNLAVTKTEALESVLERP